jgi:hypothetical protein
MARMAHQRYRGDAGLARPSACIAPPDSALGRYHQNAAATDFFSSAGSPCHGRPNSNAWQGNGHHGTDWVSCSSLGRS